jgi:hypothetical protein
MEDALGISGKQHSTFKRLGKAGAYRAHNLIEVGNEQFRLTLH